jgi:DNA-binding GntR family transcriptional regulator
LTRHHDATKAFVAASDADGYYQANVAFHEAIYRGSHNRYLADRTLTLRNRLAPYRRVQLRNRNRPQESFDEHEAILDAIVHGRPEEADRLLQRHVTVQGGSFHDFLASLPDDVLKEVG